MACNGVIDADILFDCDFPAIGGIEVNVVLINREQVDVTATTYSGTNKTLMTAFALTEGSSYTGYSFQGVKQVNSTAFELVKKETGPDKFRHVFNGIILNPSAENKLQLQQMAEGGKYVAIVEKKWKGEDNEDAFDVFGIDSGLELNVVTYNSNENDGTISIELSNAENYEEPKVPATLLLTDYATTKTAFDNKFAAST